MEEHCKERKISFRNKLACQISIPCHHTNYCSPLTADELVTHTVDHLAGLVYQGHLLQMLAKFKIRNLSNGTEEVLCVNM